MILPIYLYGQPVLRKVAEDVPADTSQTQEDVPTITEDDILDMMSSLSINVGNTVKTLYTANPFETTQTVAGMRYDEETNTLYLTDYRETKCQIIANYMGGDFTISVQGDNKIRNIVVFGMAVTKEMALEKGVTLEKDYIFDAGLLITGTGDLEINANRTVEHAIQFHATNTKGKLIIDPKTNVSAKAGEGNLVFVAEEASEAPEFILPEYNGDVEVGTIHTTQEKEVYVLEQEDLVNCIAKDAEKYPGEYGYATYYDENNENGVNKYFELCKVGENELPIAVLIENATDEEFNTNQDEYEAKLVDCYMIPEKTTSVEMYNFEEETKFASTVILTEDGVYLGSVHDIFEQIILDTDDRIFVKTVSERAKALPEGWTPVEGDQIEWQAYLAKLQYNHVNCLHNGNSVKVTKKATAATYFKAGCTVEKTCVDCGDIRVPSKVIAKKVFQAPTLKAARKSFTASWKKASGATGYSIKYSLNKSMKNYKKKTVKAKYLKGTVKNLKAKRTYYVQVRAYKKVNGKYQYSNWSKVKTIKTK